MISMSVAQTAIASIRTSTSAGPGSGTGLSTRRQLLGIAEHPGLHRLGNLVFVACARAGRAELMSAASKPARSQANGCCSVSPSPAIANAAASAHWSSHTSVKSWPMKWLGVMLQPLSFDEVTTMRFHHKQRHGICLGQGVALEIAHDLGALGRDRWSPPGRYRARRGSGRSQPREVHRRQVVRNVFGELNGRIVVEIAREILRHVEIVGIDHLLPVEDVAPVARSW